MFKLKFQKGSPFSLWEGGGRGNIKIIFIYCTIFLKFATYFLFSLQGDSIHLAMVELSLYFECIILCYAFLVLLLL